MADAHLLVLVLSWVMATHFDNFCGGEILPLRFSSHVHEFLEEIYPLPVRREQARPRRRLELGTMHHPLECASALGDRLRRPRIPFGEFSRLREHLVGLGDGLPVRVHLGGIPRLLEGNVIEARLALHDIQPILHMLPAIALEAREMHEQIAAHALVVVAEFVGVVPFPRLEEGLALVVEVGLVHDEAHGGLVDRDVQVDVGDVHGEGDGFGQHGQGPGVHAEEEGAGVDALVVAVAQEANVGELGGGKEDGQWDGGVDDDEVGVDPPAGFALARGGCTPV